MMSGEGIAAILTSAGTLLTVVANIVIQLRGAQKSSDERAALHDKMQEVQDNTDGMKDQLVAEVRKASFASGVKSEVDKQEHP